MGAIGSAGQLSWIGGSCVKWHGLHPLWRSCHLGPCRKVFNRFANSNANSDANAHTNTHTDADSHTDSDADANANSDCW